MLKGKSSSGFTRYFKEIKSLFPVYKEKEKQYLCVFRKEVEAYADSHTDCGYKQITDFFGEPKDVFTNYLTEVEQEYLSRPLRTARHVKIGVVIVVALALIASSVVVALKYKDYSEGKASYIAREIQIIDKE